MVDSYSFFFDIIGRRNKNFRGGDPMNWHAFLNAGYIHTYIEDASKDSNRAEKDGQLSFGRNYVNGAIRQSLSPELTDGSRRKVRENSLEKSFSTPLTGAILSKFRGAL